MGGPRQAHRPHVGEPVWRRMPVLQDLRPAAGIRAKFGACSINLIELHNGSSWRFSRARLALRPIMSR